MNYQPGKGKKFRLSEGEKRRINDPKDTEKILESSPSETHVEKQSEYIDASNELKDVKRQYEHIASLYKEARKNNDDETVEILSGVLGVLQEKQKDLQQNMPEHPGLATK